MSVVSEIVDYIDAQLADLTVGTNLFDHQMPPAPTECVAVSVYGGAAPLQTLGPNLVWTQPRVQIAVRSTTWQAASDLTKSIWNLFKAFQSQSLGGVAYKAILPLQDPFQMTKTPEDYPVFGFNLQIEKDFS